MKQDSTGASLGDFGVKDCTDSVRAGLKQVLCTPTVFQNPDRQGGATKGLLSSARADQM